MLLPFVRRVLHHNNSVEASCYVSKTFHFAGIELPYTSGQDVPIDLLSATKASEEEEEIN